MNDYAGLASALLAGVGIGELPPLVQPELLRNGRLVEVMPKWRFRTVDLSVVHLRQPVHSTSRALIQGVCGARWCRRSFPQLPT